MKSDSGTEKFDKDQYLRRCEQEIQAALDKNFINQEEADRLRKEVIDAASGSPALAEDGS